MLPIHLFGVFHINTMTTVHIGPSIRTRWWMKIRLSCRHACNSLEWNIILKMLNGENKPKMNLEKLRKSWHIYKKSDAVSLSASEGDLPNTTELNKNSVTSKKVGFKYRRSRMEFTYAPIRVAQPRIPPSWNWEPSSLSGVMGEQTKSLVVHFWSSCWSPVVSFSLQNSGWTRSDIQDD